MRGGLTRFCLLSDLISDSGSSSTSTETFEPLSITTPRSRPGLRLTMARRRSSPARTASCVSVSQRPPPPDDKRWRRRQEIDWGGGSTTMSREVAHVSMSHRSSHSTIGVEEGDRLIPSDSEFVEDICGDAGVRLPADTSYSILKRARSWS
jgi:hypothetical protein